MLLLPPNVAWPPTPSSSELAPLPQRLWRFCAEYVLGTRLETLIYSTSRADASIAAEVARAEIERLNQVLNHRRHDSEISGLLRVRRATVSADLLSVLELSEIWRALSHGAFDGRMGALLQLWASDDHPGPVAIERALAAVRGSTITLEPSARRVELSPSVTLSLDALAKGYIVDAALEAVRRALPALEGVAINIGGDVRCWGQAPTADGWRIGIPDPAIPAENSPLVDAVALSNAAIATSGIGPRDRTRNGYRSTTISPISGCPVHTVLSASVVAGRAADADAMATACLVLRPDDSIAMIDRIDGAAARITEAGGRVHVSRGWPTLQRVAPWSDEAPQAPGATPFRTVSYRKDATEHNGAQIPPQLRWPRNWELAVSYSASDFSAGNFTSDLRDPYIAVWITDARNRPVTTLLLLGTDLRWARENFIWWDSYAGHAKHEVYTHSRPTTRSGQYDMEWLGVDEKLQPVPIGKYILHFETSRQHGKHTYRSIPLQIGRQQFSLSVPDLDGMGSLSIAYKPYITPVPAGQ